MIEVIIRHKGSEVELGRIDIENVSDDGNGDLADYSIRFAVDNGGGFGIHQRGLFQFPRRTHNVFGLVRAVLDALTEPEMRLDGRFESPSRSRSQILARKFK